MAIFNAGGMSFESPTMEDANKRLRLFQIAKGWEQFPGRMPGGTGPTGLTPNDARGWSDMLNDQTFALGQMNKGGVNVETAPFQEQHYGAFGQGYEGSSPYQHLTRAGAAPENSGIPGIGMQAFRGLQAYNPSRVYTQQNPMGDVSEDYDTSRPASPRSRSRVYSQQRPGGY